MIRNVQNNTRVKLFAWRVTHSARCVNVDSVGLSSLTPALRYVMELYITSSINAAASPTIRPLALVTFLYVQEISI